MWSAATVVTPPDAPAIALDSIKEFLRIDAETDDFDAQLIAFADVAVSHIEAVCGIRLAPQQLELRADEWADLARLPTGPVTAIDAIHYLDGDGAEQLLDDATYELAGAGLEMGIRPAFGRGWPLHFHRSPGAIRVTLTAGYAALPPPLWAAALYLTGDLFAFRETASPGGASTIPMSATVEAMLTNFRIWL